MPIIEKKIREFWDRYDIKDPILKDAIRAGMVYLAEEIIDAVEQQHKHLVDKDDLKQVIEMMNARFEAIQKEMNARFEAIQKEMNVRFEAIQKEMNARFEAMDKRFQSIEKRLGFIQWLIGSGLLLVALKLFFPNIFPQ